MNESNITSAGQPGSKNYTPPSKNLVETVGAAGQFSILSSGIQASGLSDALMGKGPFTVFAPTDEAFKKLPSGAMDALRKDPAKFKAVLSYHVVAGYVSARDIKAGDMMTLQGTPMAMAIADSGVHVNGAVVKQVDIAATNGVVHAIDAVIMPKNWQLLAAAA
jgi:uncharacterized surface protein with fasciclin (FAS1) repeats